VYVDVDVVVDVLVAVEWVVLVLVAVLSNVDDVVSEAVETVLLLDDTVRVLVLFCDVLVIEDVEDSVFVLDEAEELVDVVVVVVVAVDEEVVVVVVQESHKAGHVVTKNTAIFAVAAVKAVHCDARIPSQIGGSTMPLQSTLLATIEMELEVDVCDVCDDDVVVEESVDGVLELEDTELDEVVDVEVWLDIDVDVRVENDAVELVLVLLLVDVEDLVADVDVTDVDVEVDTEDVVAEEVLLVVLELEVDEVTVLVLSVDDVVEVVHEAQSTGHRAAVSKATAAETAVSASHCSTSNIWHSAGSARPLQLGDVVWELVDVLVVLLVHVPQSNGQASLISSPIGLSNVLHNGNSDESQVTGSRLPLQTSVVVLVDVVVNDEELVVLNVETEVAVAVEVELEVHVELDVLVVVVIVVVVVVVVIVVVVTVVVVVVDEDTDVEVDVLLSVDDDVNVLVLVREETDVAVLSVDDVVEVVHEAQSTGHRAAVSKATAAETAVSASHCSTSNIWHSAGSARPLQLGDVVWELVDVLVVLLVHVPQSNGQASLISSPIGLSNVLHNGNSDESQVTGSRLPLQTSVVVLVDVVVNDEELVVLNVIVLVSVLEVDVDMVVVDVDTDVVVTDDADVRVVEDVMVLLLRDVDVLELTVDEVSVEPEVVVADETLVDVDVVADDDELVVVVHASHNMGHMLRKAAVRASERVVTSHSPFWLGSHPGGST